MRYLTLLLLPLLCTCGPAPADNSVPPAGPEPKQNVIFILADDFGITDAQGYLQKFTGADPASTFHETPHLNRLMAEGVSFTQAYATQLCSPTRAGILSGKYAARVGFMTAMPLRETYYNQAMEVPEGYSAHDVLDHHDDIKIQQAWTNATSNSALPTGAPEDAGRDILSLAEAMPEHRSAFIGKWHIGGFGAHGHQPADHGFTPLAWYDSGASSYFNWRGGWKRDAKNRFPEMPQDRWEMGDPGPATGEDYLTDDLTAQALNFLDEHGQGEQPFFLYFSHFAVHAPYQAKDSLVNHFTDKPTRGANGHEDATYAAMIKSMDASVGALLDKLDQLGIAENTLVVFMSDNGGIDRKLTPKGDGTDNVPFLGGKAMLTEGGVRVPLIFRQKGKTPGGKWVEMPVDYTDIYPSLVAAAGYTTDNLIEEQDLDGQSLLPLIDDSEGNDIAYSKDVRYWHYPFNVIYNSPYDKLPLTPHSAIRLENHKLIFDWHGRLHLYDLDNDPYEKNDLAEEYPELRDRLFNQLMTWLDNNVDRRYWPQLNPDYDASKEARAAAFIDLTDGL